MATAHSYAGMIHTNEHEHAATLQRQTHTTNTHPACPIPSRSRRRRPLRHTTDKLTMSSRFTQNTACKTNTLHSRVKRVVRMEEEGSRLKRRPAFAFANVSNLGMSCLIQIQDGSEELTPQMQDRTELACTRTVARVNLVHLATHSPGFAG